LLMITWTTTWTLLLTHKCPRTKDCWEDVSKVTSQAGEK